MSRAARDKRWESKFAQFVQDYGVERLARQLRIAPSAIYHWMRGRTSPHPARAIEVQRIAKRRGVDLSLDEIYQHFRDVHAESYKPATPHARAI